MAKEDGDFVELDETIAEVDSDKATFELPAEANGILSIVAQEDEILEISALICRIEVMESGIPSNSLRSSFALPETNAASSGDETYATGHASVASEILAEKEIDPSTVTGTGKNGRITKEDAEKAQKSAAAPRYQKLRQLKKKNYILAVEMSAKRRCLH